MSENDIEKLQKWIDSSKKTVLEQYSQDLYNKLKLKTKINLPNLPRSNND
ncbi:MAG: hypothetical protein ACI8TE_000178 [Francisella sp.]|jgi:hypothetical protein